MSSFFKINLTHRIFWIVAIFAFSSTLLETIFRYQNIQDIIETRGYNRALALHDYFVSMRYVYHHQFLDSNIELNDSTIGFLPAHASLRISDEFAARTNQGVSIKNVTDRPRNPKNKADSFELEMIDYFKANPDQNISTKRIMQDKQEYFFFASPLKIQPYCLSCHGEKNQTISYIQSRYSEAYNYKLGDVRGITSIKIPIDELSKQMMRIFWNGTLFTFLIMTLLLAIVYATISKVTSKEEQIKESLESVVKERTEELKEAYKLERHLTSILRSVADVNQLLITTKNMDELLLKAAYTLSQNEAFASVKIVVLEDDKLSLKAFFGLVENEIVTELDQKIFLLNEPLKIVDLLDTNLPEHCKQKAKIFDIKAVYAAPLKSSSFAKNPMGVITVCTKMEDGFSQKDIEMIDELAGDIGFAINSFVQQKQIESLNAEKIGSYKEFVEALVDMIEQRDTYTAGHTRRVANYSIMIAKEMGIDDESIKLLTEAAKLHDIGKVVTPDSVLLKPGALTDLEYELIKEHVNAGYQVLLNIASYKELAETIVSHHERYDGSGYPHQKKADEIPLLGHILAVADSFDAMTTNRIYKTKKSVDESIVELQTLSGTQYHPDVVEAAVSVLSSIELEAGADQAICVSDIDKERLSYFFKDRLTKLYNEDYLTLIIGGRFENKVPSSFIAISLCDFTAYNKIHGWEGGNTLLYEFAEYLKQSCPDKLLFRIWGDHFLIADFDGDIDNMLSLSVLVQQKVGYKFKKIYAPFADIKEVLLG